MAAAVAGVVPCAVSKDQFARRLWGGGAPFPHMAAPVSPKAPRPALGAPLECVRAQRLDGSPCHGWLLPTCVELGADVGVFMYEPKQCHPTWVAWSELHPLHPERAGVWRFFEPIHAEVAAATARREDWAARGARVAGSDLANAAVGSVSPALRNLTRSTCGAERHIRIEVVKTDADEGRHIRIDIMDPRGNYSKPVQLLTRGFEGGEPQHLVLPRGKLTGPSSTCRSVARRWVHQLVRGHAGV